MRGREDLRVDRCHYEYLFTSKALGGTLGLFDVTTTELRDEGRLYCETSMKLILFPRRSLNLI